MQPRKEKPVTKTMSENDQSPAPVDPMPRPNSDAVVAMERTLDNTTVSQARDTVPDLKVFGDGNLFKLISKASSQREGWMKSTKAMEIPKVGVVIQVTTQFHDRVAEALVFVPGVMIQENGPMDGGPDGGRRIINDARIV